MPRVLIVLLSALLVLSQDANSQSFKKGTVVDVPHVNDPVTAFADYDNDDDMDLLLVGIRWDKHAVQLYSLEDGLFSAVKNSGLPAAGSGGQWIDVDNDDDLDALIYLSGNLGSSADFYMNNNGHFTPMGLSLPNLIRATYWPADYDGDGDADLLMFGKSGVSVITQLYKNDNGSFVSVESSLFADEESRASWVDCDKDGDLDVYCPGASSHQVNYTKTRTGSSLQLRPTFQVDSAVRSVGPISTRTTTWIFLLPVLIPLAVWRRYI